MCVERRCTHIQKLLFISNTKINNLHSISSRVSSLLERNVKSFVLYYNNLKLPISYCFLFVQSYSRRIHERLSHKAPCLAMSVAIYYDQFHSCGCKLVEVDFTNILDRVVTRNIFKIISIRRR